MPGTPVPMHYFEGRDGVRIAADTWGDPDGPLVVKGPVDVRSGDGANQQEGVKSAFCRCGASANKPYCDGSHAAIGFRG